MAFFLSTKTAQAGRTRRSGLGWRLLPALVVCSIGVLMAGCHSSSAGGGEGSGGGGQDDVIAKVNDDSITQGQMYDFMQRLTPQQLSGSPNTTVGRFALTQLITADLLAQMAKAQNVPVTDEEVTQRYNDLELITESQSPVPYEEILSQQGLTPDTYKQDLVRPQIAQFNLLTRNAQATPQEVLASYNANKSKYIEPQAVKFDRVILPTEAAAESVYDAASKGAPLTNFQSQSQSPPTPGSDPTLFPQWIATDPPAAGAGPLGPPLKAAKIGDTIKPIQIGPGWWVVHVIDVRPKTIMPFDKVQNIVRMSVLQTKTGSQDASTFIHDMQQFNQSAAITITPPQYQDIAQQFKNPAPQSAPMAPPPSAPAPSAPQQK